MKKGFKAVLSIALAAAMMFGMTACGGGNSGGGDDSAAEAGKVLNIWCWNDEFQSRFNDYYPGVAEVAEDKSTTTLEDGTVVKWTINPNEGMNYQDKLDAALLAQESAADDEKIDIFLVEADYALKYVDSDYTVDVKELGLTDASRAHALRRRLPADACD